MTHQDIDRIAKDVARGVRVREVKTIEGKVDHLGRLIERIAIALQALNARIK